ncbi:unnamed protein product [Ilex paraguariensis]|uniref:Cyclin-dependent kinase inhibitor domain-containing protein n=1 Tax=Ilex paraguariensis TaxID=185542 RepID=A0ABC8U5L9_9AQUA
MGKFMRKSKTTGERALVEASLGVRTRAKTLALRRLKKSAAAPLSTAAAVADSDGSYLQLRSRRLEKPQIVVANIDAKRQRQHPKQSNLPNPRQEKVNQNPSSKTSSRLRVGSSANSGSFGEENGCMQAGDKMVGKEEGCLDTDNQEIDNKEESGDRVLEASFGENMFEFEGRERSARETTPFSLIRDPDNIRTLGSTTSPTSSTEANGIIQNSMERHIPMALEMEEFFAGAEKEQQRQFVEKYNFDLVNEKPLLGRYEWVKMEP